MFQQYYRWHQVQFVSDVFTSSMLRFELSGALEKTLDDVKSSSMELIFEFVAIKIKFFVKLIYFLVLQRRQIVYFLFADEFIFAQIRKHFPVNSSNLS